MEAMRFDESVWQDQNIHARGRHDVSRTPELKEQMNPADIKRAIDRIAPAEEPYMSNPFSLRWP
jgi:hypothetical protein